MSSDEHLATSSRDDSREGWQGRRAAVSYSAPQYRWQGGGGSNVAQQVSRPRRRQRWWILFWLIVLWGLYGVYVALLAYAPRKVPLVTAVATEYELPLPPNAWADEDLKLLMQLNGENLRLIDTSKAWTSRSTGMAQWEQRIQELARQGSPSRVALFYVSMHGAVDERGRPCLIPPGIAPLDSLQWIPIEEMLQPLSQLPADWRKIVFLDASRQPDNWGLGILENTFADRLPEAIERAKVPGLSVMNSAGPEQINWTSPDLAGSTFGRAVALGLAGVADSSLRAGGDANGRVSLLELHRYVARRARLWALRNRAAVQVPQLLPKDAADFVIAKSLYTGDARELGSNLNARPRAKDAVSAESLAQLWRQYDALRKLQAHQGDPIAWRDLEQRLLRLEQLATAGQAYHAEAEQLLRDLSTQLSRAQEQIEGIADRPALAARVSLLDPRAADWPRQLSLHSLPLCEYFGVVNSRDAAKLRQQLDELASAVDLQQFDARLRAALQSGPRAEIFNGLVETHMLRMGQQYRIPGIWNGPVALQRMLELRQRADQLMTGSEERSHYWTRREWLEMDGLRRRAEDLVFAGPEVAGPEPWQPAFVAFDRALNASEGWTARFRVALDTRDRALAMLPHLAKLYASREPLGKPVAGTANDLVPSEIESAIMSTLRLGRRLDAIPTTAMSDVEANETIDLALKLASQLDSLEKRHEDHCQRLLTTKQGDPATLRGLELALAVPLVGWELRRDVRQEAQSLGSRLHEAFLKRAARDQTKEAKPPTEPAPSDPTSLEGSRDRLNNWPVHPLLAILELDQGREGVTRVNSAPAIAAPVPPPSATAPKTDGAPDTAANKTSGQTLDDPKPATEDEPAETAVTRDQLARWEQDASRIRQRLMELSRWTPTGALAGAHAANAGVKLNGESTTATALNPAATKSTDLSISSEGLASASDPVVSDPAASAESLDEASLGRAVRDARAELSRAEYQLRAAAALGAPAPDWNPVRQLRKFDLQQVLLLHARRALDDFWGSGRQNRNGGPPERPFFAQAVWDHLRAAELIAPPSMVVQRQITSLRALVQQRLAAAGAVALHVDTSEPSGAADVVRFRVRAKLAGSGGTSDDSASTPVDLPPGEATVFVRQGNDILEGKRAVLSLPPGEDPAQKTVEAKSNDVSGVGLQAAFVFRGHEFSQPFFRRGLGGVLVRYEPTTHETAQVTLFGQRRQQSSVVFILDCSSSMSREIFSEAIGQEQQPRLDVAKSVLQEFLEQIAERGDTRVGVRFFGHRVGWTRSQPVKVLAQPDYAGTIPSELAPSEDVELVLPLGRFGPVETGRVVRLMPGLKPWGQSPLYLSLLQALGDFDADRTDTDKSVVVITDGGNYQFTPGATNVRARPASTLRQVTSAWKGRNVPVHIVGFGLDEESPDMAAAESEFQQITKATGGEYFPVQSGQDLMRVLRARLGLGAYRVNDDRGVSVVKPSDTESTPGIRLNSPVRITGLGAGPRKFSVDFESQSQALVLEGGERVDFDLSTEGQMTMRPFNANVVTTLPLTSGARRLLARIHRPVSDREGVTFRVSLQDENLDFTRRPDEVWVEITPVSERGDVARPTYVFYERNFEPQMPVPVVVCPIPGWPAGASSARVQLWCKFATSVSVLSRPIAQVEKQVGGDDESVPGVQGIRFRVAVVSADAQDGLTELRMTEQHSAASPGIDALRIQLNAPVDLMPQRIERQSDATAGVVVHSMFFPRDRWLRLKGDPRGKLEITTREATRDGALRAENDRAATVDVTLSSDTLPIQPPKANPPP